VKYILNFPFFALIIFSIIFSIADAQLAQAELPQTLPIGQYVTQEPPYNIKIPDLARDELLQSSLVWMPPSVPPSQFNFLKGEVDEPDAVLPSQEVVCKWLPGIEMSGMMPQFTCVTASGHILKVKYAQKDRNDNAEVVTEIAASRLLRALGFGADRMYTAKKIRCLGCPKDPWAAINVLHHKVPKVREQFLRTYGKQDRDGHFYYEPNYNKFTDFSFVSIEEKMRSNGIRSPSQKGWAWSELLNIKSQLGGSPRAHVDALYLMAAFLNLSDNKSENQRLLCLTPMIEKCDSPMAIVQDVGASFGRGWQGIRGGHSKLEVQKWRASQIWQDDRCTVSVPSPINGTFKPQVVSEEGRVFLLQLLDQLTDKNIEDIFVGARAHEFKPATPVSEWVKAFKARREQIRQKTCPN